MSRAARLAALGLLLCVLAASFAVSSLYVAGVVLVLVALAAAASVRLAARRARVEIELSMDTVEERCPARVTVRAGGCPPLLGRPELRVAPAAPWRETARRSEPVELQVTPARRGEFVVGPATLRFSDPFAICRRERTSAPARLLVLPRLERVRRQDLERLVGLGHATPSHEGGMGVGGLRPYRPGAPASRIHWLSVARHGTLLERRFEEDADERAITIALDTRAPASAQALDMAARAAASLCVGLASVGGCALLLPGWPAAHPVRPDLSTWPGLHARLALAGEGQELDWRALARARLVVLVLARTPHERSLAAGGCTVSPLPGEGTVLFSVAGCAVQASARAGEHAA
ncbi:MAG TPA: DUF58 domain-containing protein [Solirubrobacteraceae bacterium]